MVRKALTQEQKSLCVKLREKYIQVDLEDGIPNNW